MSDDKIIQKATEEIESKTLAATQQFLDIHQVVYLGTKPKVERVDRDKGDGTAIVYFPVKEERFYLAISIEANPEPEVSAIYVEPYTSVYYSAGSETIELETISGMTNLIPTSVWRKGDPKREGGRILHKDNGIRFEPTPGPDEFEDKMKKLLDFLESDKVGIKNLAKKAEGYIQVIMEFHNGNSMLGGPNISKESVKRMAALNVELDFDLYVSGKPYK
ncbi:MAG TPA: DUF4279 domain-containing protein [Puia sp.]|nr:DUF4279 domain-containing protein [Puia sp.]